CDLDIAEGKLLSIAPTEWSSLKDSVRDNWNAMENVVRHAHRILVCRISREGIDNDGVIRKILGDPVTERFRLFRGAKPESLVPRFAAFTGDVALEAYYQDLCRMTVSLVDGEKMRDSYDWSKKVTKVKVNHSSERLSR